MRGEYVIVFYENNKDKDIEHNYNYIRVNKKEYEKYLKSRGSYENKNK